MMLLPNAIVVQVLPCAKLEQRLLRLFRMVLALLRTSGGSSGFFGVFCLAHNGRWRGKTGGYASCGEIMVGVMFVAGGAAIGEGRGRGGEKVMADEV